MDRIFFRLVIGTILSLLIVTTIIVLAAGYITTKNMNERKRVGSCFFLYHVLVPKRCSYQCNCIIGSEEVQTCDVCYRPCYDGIVGIELSDNSGNVILSDFPTLILSNRLDSFAVSNFLNVNLPVNTTSICFYDFTDPAVITFQLKDTYTFLIVVIVLVACIAAMSVFWITIEVGWCVSSCIKKRKDLIDFNLQNIPKCKECNKNDQINRGTVLKPRYNGMCNACETRKTISDVLSKNLEKSDRQFSETFINDAIEMNTVTPTITISK